MQSLEELVASAMPTPGTINTDELRRNVIASMRSILAERTAKHDIKARSAWDAMTDWEKCKWVIVNRIIPSIGQEIRKQYDAAIALKYALENKGYEGFYRHFPDPQLPHWALYDPDSVLVMDIKMTLHRPLEKIAVDFIVDANPDAP